MGKVASWYTEWRKQGNDRDTLYAGAESSSCHVAAKPGRALGERYFPGQQESELVLCEDLTLFASFRYLSYFCYWPPVAAAAAAAAAELLQQPNLQLRSR